MYSRGRNEKSGDKDGFSLIEDSRSETKCSFTMKGRVSLNESSHMEYKLNQAIDAGCIHIIVNMSLVKSMSSAGIRVILALYKKLKKMGGALQIENPSENVRNVIGLTALDELLLK